MESATVEAPQGRKKLNLSNLLIGRPLETRTLAHQVVSKKIGLAVFAPAPGGPIELLARWRLWLLRRRMGCPFYALNPGDKPLAWTEATPPQPAAAPRVGAQ